VKGLLFYLTMTFVLVIMGNVIPTVIVALGYYC